MSNSTPLGHSNIRSWRNACRRIAFQMLAARAGFRVAPAASNGEDH